MFKKLLNCVTRRFCFFFPFITFSVAVNYRLPNNCRPLHYIVKIEPHMIFENSTFDGSVEVFLEVLSPTKNLTLHSSKLTIVEKETVLIDARGKITPRHIFEEIDTLVLNFNSTLKAGIYVLKMKFSGFINSGVLGNFYSATGLCWYTHKKNNKTKHFLTTNLQPSFARQVFPCWDEPKFKATFDIAIKHFCNYTVHSNMPVEKKINAVEGKVWTGFKTTPVMSVHQVAFSISDFVKKTRKDKFSIWYANSRFGLTTQILDVALEASRILEQYTEIKFSLPKIDFLVFPSLDKIDNWGLIYVWEDSILEKSTSLAEDKQAISSIIVPAIVQQWFGNLVGPDWWSDLWVIEGLSSYLQYFVIAEILNNPRIIDYFFIKGIENSFLKDIFPSNIPIYRDVKISNEYLMEDVVMSCKPAAIMNMLSNLISKEVFYSGVKNLLKKYKFKTIKTDDFWNVMQVSLNETKVKDIINIKLAVEPYLSQIGYPIINVVRDYENGTIKLTQECAVCSRENDKKGNKWWIPINFATNRYLNFTSTLATHWMNPKKKEVIIAEIDPKDWIIFNIQGTGYYRVNYDPINWKRISDYLNSEEFLNIHFLNRARLLQDAVWFWQKKKLDTKFLMTLASYLKRETNVIPCLESERIFVSLSYCTDYQIFKNFTLPLVDIFLKGTNFKSENNEILLNKLRRFSLAWKNGLETTSEDDCKKYN